jgi:hypothetical protein
VALSKVGLSARSEAAAVTARQIANRENRIWIAELVYRSNPWGGEKFWFSPEERVSGNGTRFVWYGEGRAGCGAVGAVLGPRESAARIRF